MWLFGKSKLSENDLQQACRDIVAVSASGDVAKAKALLKKCNKADLKTLLNHRDELGKTAFYLSVEGNHLEMAKLLISHGADVISADHKCNGPLHIAASQGNVEMVKAILSVNAGAVVNTDGRGRTSLYVSIQHSQLACCKVIIEKCGEDQINAKCAELTAPTAFMLALEPAKEEFLDVLIKRGIPVKMNTTNQDRETSLHVICKDGNIKQLHQLLQWNANTSVTTQDGTTPLHYAAMFGNEDCCLVLLEANVVLECRDANGNTPLFYAAQHGLKKVVEAMIKKNRTLALLRNNDGLNAKEFADAEFKGDHNLKGELFPTLDSACQLKEEEPSKVFKLQVCSDLHIEFFGEEPVPPILEKAAPYLALLGDIGLAKDESYKQYLLQQAEIYDKVFVIAGNHEYYHNTVESTKNTIRDICSQHKNLVYMQQTSVLVDGVRLLGTTLWSDVPKDSQEEVEMSLSDFRCIKNLDERLNIQQYVQWHKEERLWLEEEISKAKQHGEKVVVMTHHAPVINLGSSDPQFFDSKSNSAFCSDLRYILGAPVEVWAYGHTHWFQDMNINGTRVISNPRGYQTSVAFNPKFVINIAVPDRDV